MTPESDIDFDSPQELCTCTPFVVTKNAASGDVFPVVIQQTPSCGIESKIGDREQTDAQFNEESSYETFLRGLSATLLGRLLPNIPSMSDVLMFATAATASLLSCRLLGAIGSNI